MRYYPCCVEYPSTHHGYNVEMFLVCYILSYLILVAAYTICPQPGAMCLHMAAFIICLSHIPIKSSSRSLPDMHMCLYKHLAPAGTRLNLLFSVMCLHY